MKNSIRGVSPIRKSYFVRLVVRTLIFCGCGLVWFCAPNEFEVLRGWNFFRSFSILHLLWSAWILDMLAQLVPIKGKFALGSQKLFRQRFRPVDQNVDRLSVHQHMGASTKSALKVAGIWTALLAVIAILYARKILHSPELFMISVAFYVCDLICVLIWCPFRFIMKTRCCTTCRIYNWDHLMMFSPMVFIQGFYSASLLIVAAVVFGLWEVCILLHPERFWERTNKALRCAECRDKLCGNRYVQNREEKQNELSN